MPKWSQQASTVAVLLIVVVAFVGGAGYMLVEHTDHEITGQLSGALIAAFVLIIRELFEKAKS